MAGSIKIVSAVNAPIVRDVVQIDGNLLGTTVEGKVVVLARLVLAPLPSQAPAPTRKPRASKMGLGENGLGHFGPKPAPTEESETIN